LRKICSLILILSVTVNFFAVSCSKNIKNDKTVKVVEEININEDSADKEVESKKDVDVSNEVNNEKKVKEPKEINGFVLLNEIDKDFVIDLRYATENNFTKQKVYPNDICVLRKDTALKLAKANEEFKKLGYRIKIWDAYRPVYVQRIFWNIVMNEEAKSNMTILTNIMVQSGFKIINTEWWHFDDINSGNYNIEDVDLNLFLN